MVNGVTTPTCAYDYKELHIMCDLSVVCSVYTSGQIPHINTYPKT